MPALSQVFIDGLTHQAVNLRKLEDSAAKAATRILRQAEKDILADLAERSARRQLARPGSSITWREARMAEVLENVNATLATAYDDIETRVGKRLQDSAAFSFESTADTLKDGLEPLGALASVNTVAVGPELLERISRDAFVSVGDGAAVVGEWWASQEGKIRENLARSFRAGMLLGEGVPGLTRRLQDASTGMPIAKRWATAIARTSVISAAEEARNQTYNANRHVAKGVYHYSTLDKRTTVICVTYSGKGWLYTKDGRLEPSGHSLPYGSGVPRHVACFPADVVASTIGGLEAHTRRWYQGDLLILRTASGSVLPCTPNHPILTNRGFVAAKDLYVGDKLVDDLAGERVGIIDAEMDHMEAGIHQMAGSFGEDVAVVTVEVPLASPDFHGDAADGEVAVVTADGNLTRRFYAPIDQHAVDAIFQYRRAALGRGVGPGDLAAMLLGMGSARRNVRSLGEALSLGRIGSVHPGLLLLATIAQLAPRSLQAVAYGVDAVSRTFEDATYTDALVVEAQNFGHPVGWNVPGDDVSVPVAGLTGFGQNGADRSRPLADDLDGLHHVANFAVGHDDLLAIDVRERWRGHVYSLQTGSGLFRASGLIVANCRSASLPWLKTWEEQGFDADELNPQLRRAFGPRATAPRGDFNAALKVDPDLARKVLGPTRHDLWKSGRAKLDDFVDPKTGQPWKVAELRAMFADGGTPPTVKPKKGPKATVLPKVDAVPGRV